MRLLQHIGIVLLIATVLAPLRAQNYAEITGAIKVTNVAAEQRGGELRRDRFNETGNAFTRGNFNFEEKATLDPTRPSTTGHTLADFLLVWARVSQKARTFSNGLFRATSFALYAEDTWKITTYWWDLACEAGISLFTRTSRFARGTVSSSASRPSTSPTTLTGIRQPLIRQHPRRSEGSSRPARCVSCNWG